MACGYYSTIVMSDEWWRSAFGNPHGRRSSANHRNGAAAVAKAGDRS